MTNLVNLRNWSVDPLGLRPLPTNGDVVRKVEPSGRSTYSVPNASEDGAQGWVNLGQPLTNPMQGTYVYYVKINSNVNVFTQISRGRQIWNAVSGSYKLIAILCENSARSPDVQLVKGQWFTPMGQGVFREDDWDYLKAQYDAGKLEAPYFDYTTMPLAR